MELELVSIKESSQGCSGSGWQECCFCLIIQINDDHQRAGAPQLPDRWDHIPLASQRTLSLLG